MEALIDHECYMTTYSGSKFQKVSNMRCGDAPRRTRKLVEFDTMEELEKEETLSLKRKECTLSLQMQMEMGNRTSDRTLEDFLHEVKRRKSGVALATVERSPPSVGRSFSVEGHSPGKKRKRVRNTSDLSSCTKILAFTEDDQGVQGENETLDGWLKRFSVNRRRSIVATSKDSSVKVFERRKVRVEAFEYGRQKPVVKEEAMEVNMKVSNPSTEKAGSMIISEDERETMTTHVVQKAISRSLQVGEDMLESKVSVCGSITSGHAEQIRSNNFCLQTYVTQNALAKRDKDQASLVAPRLAHSETIIISDGSSQLEVHLWDDNSDETQQTSLLDDDLTQQVELKHAEKSLDFCKLGLGAPSEAECHEVYSQVVMENLGCSRAAASMKHEGKLISGSTGSKDSTNVTAPDLPSFPEENRSEKDERAAEGRREVAEVKTGPETSAHGSAICPISLETLHEAVGGGDEVGDQFQSDELNKVAMSELVRIHPAETEMVSEGAEKGCCSKEVNLDASKKSEGFEPGQGVECEPESSSMNFNFKRTHVEQEVLGECNSVHNGYDTVRNSSMICAGGTAREGIKEKLCDLKVVEDGPKINMQLPIAKVTPVDSASQMTFTSNSHEKSGSLLVDTSAVLPSTSWHSGRVGDISATVVTPTELESAAERIDAIIDSLVTPADLVSEDPLKSSKGERKKKKRHSSKATRCPITRSANKDTLCRLEENTASCRDLSLCGKHEETADAVTTFTKDDFSSKPKEKAHNVSTISLGNSGDDIILNGVSTVGDVEELHKVTHLSPEVGRSVESFIPGEIPNAGIVIVSPGESESLGGDQQEDNSWSRGTACSDMVGINNATEDVGGLLKSKVLSASSVNSQDDIQWPDSTLKGPSKLPCNRKGISPRSQQELLQASRPHRLPSFRIKLLKSFSKDQSKTSNDQSEIKKSTMIMQQALQDVDKSITLDASTGTKTPGISDSGEQIHMCVSSDSQALSPSLQSIPTNSPILDTPSPSECSSQAATTCQEHIAPGSPEHNKHPSLTSKTTDIQKALLQSDVSAFLKSNCEGPGSPITPTKVSESSQQLKSILKPSCVRADMEVVPCQGSCKCPRCITTCDQAKIAMEFIASQMSYADRITGRLLEEIASLRTLMEKQKSGVDRGPSISSPDSPMKDAGSLDISEETEKWAHKELLQMSRDSKRVCRLLDRGPRKIMFADEAGRRLCQVKLLPAEKTCKELGDTISSESRGYKDGTNVTAPDVSNLTEENRAENERAPENQREPTEVETGPEISAQPEMSETPCS